MNLVKFFEENLKKDTYTKEEVCELILKALDEVKNMMQTIALRQQAAYEQSEAAYEQKYGVLPPDCKKLFGK